MTVLARIGDQGCGCDEPEQLAALISIDEALARIARHAVPVVGTEVLLISRAVGRILAEPVRATAMTPAFDNSAMDGYAVDTSAFAGDGPWTFPVISRVPAGAAATTPVGENGVARILTGAPVPEGADAVIRQEDASRSGDLAIFSKRPASGSNIRRAGSDMQPDQIVIEAGARLGSREIAACAAAGACRVHVHRTLRAGLLVTGNEVRPAGAGRGGAEIWDVNTPMLCAALASRNIDLVHVGQVADDRTALEDNLAKLVGRVDLLVTTGGVSVGEEDHVKPALCALGGEVQFSGVAIKPGKPVSFGRIGSSHWLGLPGNPLAAFVTWKLFGTALVCLLTGQSNHYALRRHVVTAAAIHRKPGRCEFRPASVIRLDDKSREVVTFEYATHSGRVGRLATSDGLIVLPADSDHLPAGTLVEFLSFRDD